MTENSGYALTPGQNIKPLVPIDLAKELIWRLYKLKVKSVKELNGYDDINYLVQVDSNGGDSEEKTFVFKVSNYVDSQTPDFFDACNEMMLYLYNQGFAVNVPIKNADGKFQSLEPLKNSEGETKSNIIRLLTFVKGDILYNVPINESLCYQTGELAAALDNSLQGFHHPFYESRQTIWMLSKAPQIRPFLFAVQEESRKLMVESILQEFEEEVLTNVDILPKGIIHGDINEQNIIVRTGENKAWVHGVLDFGDTQINCYVFELALATIYMMLVGNLDNFIELGGHTIAGYLSKRPITRLEWEYLKICIETRYCQSLVMGAYSHRMDPSNTYVLTTSKNGWDQLTRFRNTPKETVYDIWRQVLSQRGLPTYMYPK